MKEYISMKNFGWLLTGLLGLILTYSAFLKMSGSEESLELLGAHNLTNWITIIGIGEFLSLILFVIPQTMRLGTLLLSAYFGGAIVFHMAHPITELTDFTAPASFLVLTWFIASIRGFRLFSFYD